MFQRELTLMKQVNQKSVCFVIIGILKTLVINFNHMFVIIAILNAKGVDYRCILSGISKNDAINRLNNSVLEDKSVLIKGFWCDARSKLAEILSHWSYESEAIK